MMIKVATARTMKEDESAIYMSTQEHLVEDFGIGNEAVQRQLPRARSAPERDSYPSVDYS